MASDSFSSLSISRAQLANLETLAYHKMTAVQAQSLPHVLKGRDLIARAKTGSGKTAAFGIGILEQILSLIHISEPTRPELVSRMPSSA